jgi:hypothetical protein
MKKIYFIAILLAFTFTKAQVYQTQSVPFQLYQGVQPVQYAQDDLYSPVIAIPFSFNFFGVDYQNLLVSSNGFVTFNTATASALSPWALNLQIPNVQFTAKNAIFGVFHDIYNVNSQGSYFTGVSGSAPYRKFAITFKNIPQFNCTSFHSTTQIILYETTNFIDVQIQEKPVCTLWNSGNALLGVLNATGNQGFTPPNRNTGAWYAANEGWRFKPYSATQALPFTVCSQNGVNVINLTAIATGILQNAMFFTTLVDAQNFTNTLPSGNFYPTSLPQTIYARIAGTTAIYPVLINSIDCTVDVDNDGLIASSEDLNNDGNLANDDTDGDGIPNYLDDDDDGDLALTSIELINLGGKTITYLDTDGDGIPNHLDIDDDGDGILSINEDYNHNGDLTDDDLNTNGIPDYLDNSVLGIDEAVANIYDLSVYPNPVNDVLNFTANADFKPESVQLITL